MENTRLNIAEQLFEILLDPSLLGNVQEIDHALSRSSSSLGALDLWDLGQALRTLAVTLIIVVLLWLYWREIRDDEW